MSLRESSIAAIRVSTIDPKDHTAPLDGEKKSWGGSNLPAKHNGSYPSTTKSKMSFARAATPFQLLPTVKLEPTPIGTGTTSRVS